MIPKTETKLMMKKWGERWRKTDVAIAREVADDLIKSDDQIALKYVATCGGYVQVRNGVRVLIVPKEEKNG